MAVRLLVFPMLVVALAALSCSQDEITAVATATDELNSHGSDLVTVPQFCDIEVPVDIKPGSCPNPLNPKSKGVLPVAILGLDRLAVSQIDLSTIRLEGVAPIRWNFCDVGTPYYPIEGKEDCMDCNALGPDGYMDLMLKFKTQEIVAVLEGQSAGCVVLHLTGNVNEELARTAITGEDVVRLKVQTPRQPIVSRELSSVTVQPVD